MLKFKKFISILLAIAIMTSMIVMSALAESVSVLPSTNSPILNSEFTVTVKFSGTGLGSIDATINYDTNRLQCVSVPADTSNPSAGEVLISHYNANGFTEKAFQIKFKAIAEGSAKISISSSEVWTADNSTKYTPSGSTTVNIINKANLSGNANLKSMILSDNIPLNPAFNKDVTTYNISVDNSVEKVLINAVAEDKDAKLSYGGSTKMKVGDNQRWVTVTAPNGTQKKYTINIKRAAPGETIENPDEPTVNPYEVTIGEEKWILVSEYTDDIKLAGFSVSSTIVGGIELPALKSETTQEIVVFANSADGAKNGYFSYNALTGAFNVYRIYNTSANRYILLDIDGDIVLPKGYYKTNANIGGYDIDAIKYEDASLADFVIVYAEAQNGSKEYYRVDTKDNSMQRFPEFSAELKNASAMANGTFVTRFIALSNMEKLMVSAAALVAVLIIALIVVLIVRLARGSAYKDEEIEEFDELEEFDDSDFEEEEYEEEIDDEEEEF